MSKILIIEDDPSIRTGLQAALMEENYELELEQDGLGGMNAALRPGINLILLDIMLPGKNGLDICRDLRAAGVNTLVMMLTSKSDEIDKILGLEVGADDYMTKPFSIRELKARIKALLRRTRELSVGIDQAQFADLKFDFIRQEASKAEVPLKLSLKEFQIVKFFLEHEGEVIGRDVLLDKVWGYEAFPTTRTVDNYILSLRKKIEDQPSEPRHLLTVHSAGYKFVK